MTTLLTTDFLIAVDQDASRAPATWLRLQANTIRAGLATAIGDLRQHARMLLVKLEHLEQLALAPQAVLHGTPYLAPMLMLPGSLAEAA